MLVIAAVLIVATAYGFTDVFAAHSIAAQETITGDWTAKVRETARGSMLWLSLNRNRDLGRGMFQMSTDLPLRDFTGLNPDAGANAQFSLNRFGQQP